MEKLYTTSEARAVLRVSQPTLDRIMSRGELPIVRVGERGVRIAERDLRAYLRARIERRGQ